MGRLILQKDVKRISLKKYRKLKAEFAEPPTPPACMPEKIVIEIKIKKKYHEENSETEVVKDA